MVEVVVVIVVVVIVVVVETIVRSLRLTKYQFRL